jgi:CheY-like chemotaxis protein
VDPLSAKIAEQINSYFKVDPEQKFYKGQGCEFCQYSGYSGRMGVFEVLLVTPAIKESLAKDTTGLMIRKMAEKDGFTTLSRDGISKALRGLTTIEEVFRVAPPDTDEEEEEEPLPAQPVPKAFDRKRTDPSSQTPIGTAVWSPKILIVDDNVVILKILQNILEAQNFVTISAKDGAEALKLTHTERPDLIITDYMMPEMDGKALIQKLKETLSTRFIPIVMLTSRDEVDSEVEILDLGADDYLVKPIVPKRLISRVNRLLNRPMVVLE